MIDHEVVARAEFGMLVEDFLNGRLGQYLSMRAESEISAAQLSLESVDANDASAVREIQSRIAVARQWRRWLQEAVADGLAAQHEAAEADAGS